MDTELVGTVVNDTEFRVVPFLTASQSSHPTDDSTPFADAPVLRGRMFDVIFQAPGALIPLHNGTFQVDPMKTYVLRGVIQADWSFDDDAISQAPVTTTT